MSYIQFTIDYDSRYQIETKIAFKRYSYTFKRYFILYSLTVDVLSHTNSSLDDT